MLQQTSKVLLEQYHSARTTPPLPLHSKKNCRIRPAVFDLGWIHSVLIA
jgi:hypothetical protein